jgi:hypothetical protein
MDRQRRRTRGLEYGVILLMMEIFNIGLSNIPPVTLVSILGQVNVLLVTFFPLYHIVLFNTHTVDGAITKNFSSCTKQHDT